MTKEEVDQAYKVLAQHFGCSPTYIKVLLEMHFKAPSDAGNEHMTHLLALAEQDAPQATTWSLAELRAVLARFDDLRAQGQLPPLRREVAIDYVKKDKRGKYYVASTEQLQQELALQRNASIDPDGNLVQDGQIVKYGWLRSFDE